MKNFTNWLVKFGCFVKGILFCALVVSAANAWLCVYDEEFAEGFVKGYHPDVKGFRKKKDD